MGKKRGQQVDLIKKKAGYARKISYLTSNYILLAYINKKLWKRVTIY